MAPTSEPIRGMSASGLGSCQLHDLKDIENLKNEKSAFGPGVWAGLGPTFMAAQ